jgi:hypothetical protein
LERVEAFSDRPVPRGGRPIKSRPARNGHEAGGPIIALISG